jgi:hypothetical protein
MGVQCLVQSECKWWCFWRSSRRTRAMYTPLPTWNGPPQFPTHLAVPLMLQSQLGLPSWKPSHLLPLSQSAWDAFPASSKSGNVPHGVRSSNCLLDRLSPHGTEDKQHLRAHPQKAWWMQKQANQHLPFWAAVSPVLNVTHLLPPLCWGSLF